MTIPQESEIPRLPDRTRFWPFLFTGLIIIAGAVVTIGLLRQYADKNDRSEALLVRLEAQVNQLNALEWQAIGAQSVETRLVEEVTVTRAQVELTLAELLRLDINPNDLRRLNQLYRDYTSAVDEEFRLLQVGDLAQAREVDEARVDPAFQLLEQVLSEIDADYSSNVQQAARLANLGTVVLITTVVLSLGLLLWRFQWEHHRAKLAAARQTLLEEMHQKLETQVEQRTRELTVANQQLEVEICQRQQMEGLLQAAKDQLEARVADRTVELSKANERLVIELTERHRIEEELRVSLREKEVLLKEVHHRVKNNLQVVSSLLHLQASTIQNPAALAILQDSQHRVRSMALIHEKLYQTTDLSRIHLGNYINSLATYLFRSYSSQTNGVQLLISGSDVYLAIDEAVLCGLILNELISNSLKYAFLDRDAGELRVELLNEPPGGWTLRVADNGVGFPEEVDFKNSPSLGLQLVNTLVQQLDGVIELRCDGGTQFEIRRGPRD